MPFQFRDFKLSYCRWNSVTAAKRSTGFWGLFHYFSVWMVDWNVTGIHGVGGKRSGVLLWLRTVLLGVNHWVVCWSGFGSHHSTVFDGVNRIPFVWGALAGEQMCSTQWTWSLQKQMRGWCKDYSVDFANNRDAKTPTFQPTGALLMPCTMGLYKWVERQKHSLAEHKPIMDSKQFWSPVTLSTFTLPRGMSSNTGHLIVQKV